MTLALERRTTYGFDIPKFGMTSSPQKEFPGFGALEYSVGETLLLLDDWSKGRPIKREGPENEIDYIKNCEAMLDSMLAGVDAIEFPNKLFQGCESEMVINKMTAFSIAHRTFELMGKREMLGNLDSIRTTISEYRAVLNGLETGISPSLYNLDNIYAFLRQVNKLI